MFEIMLLVAGLCCCYQKNTIFKNNIKLYAAGWPDADAAGIKNNDFEKL